METEIKSVNIIYLFIIFIFTAGNSIGQSFQIIA